MSSSHTPTCIALLTKEIYADVDGWDTYFDSGKDLKHMQYHLTWHVMFAYLFKHIKFKKINNTLKELLRKNRKIKEKSKTEGLFWIYSRNRGKIEGLRTSRYLVQCF